ncbi:MAG: hypothetical protein L0Y56_09200 [Nitrospira sp.]|nr:hypothetical protein [Nitrospira sp.]
MIVTTPNYGFVTIATGDTDYAGEFDTLITAIDSTIFNVSGTLQSQIGGAGVNSLTASGITLSGAITLAGRGSVSLHVAGQTITVSGGESGGGGVSDHGALSGLTDDDHPQYSLVSGARAFTGTVEGIIPTSAAHLATKGYVDSVVDEVEPAIVSDSANLVVTSGSNTTTLSPSATPTYTSVQATTITGTTGQFGGTISAQNLSASNSLTVSGVTPMTSLAGTLESLEWFIEQPSTGTITIVQSATYPFRVDRVVSQTQSNTVKSSFRIDGTSITGLAHLAFSTTATTYTATAANQVAVGQKLDATMSGSTGAERLGLSIAITRL